MTAPPKRTALRLFAVGFLKELARSVHRLVFYVFLPLALVGLLLWQFGTRPLVEFAGRDWLRAQGFGEIEYRLETIGPAYLEISDFGAVDGRIKAERMRAAYSPKDLQSGKVQQIDLQGLEIRLDMNGFAPDLSPFLDLPVIAKARSAGDNATQHAGSQGFPFERITLSNVLIRLGEGPSGLVLEANGDVKHDDGTLIIDLTMRPSGAFGFAAMTVTGELDPQTLTGEMFMELRQAVVDQGPITGSGIEGQAAVMFTDGKPRSGYGVFQALRLNTPLGSLPVSLSIDFAETLLSLSGTVGGTRSPVVSQFDITISDPMSLSPRADFDLAMIGPSADHSMAADSPLSAVVAFPTEPPAMTLSGTVMRAEGAVLSVPESWRDILPAIECQARFAFAVPAMDIAPMVRGLSLDLSTMISLVDGRLQLQFDRLDAGFTNANFSALGVSLPQPIASLANDPWTVTGHRARMPVVTLEPAEGGALSATVSGALDITNGQALKLQAGARALSFPVDAAGGFGAPRLSAGRISVSSWLDAPFGVTVNSARLSASGPLTRLSGRGEFDLVLPLPGEVGPPSIDLRFSTGWSLGANRLALGSDAKGTVEADGFQIETDDGSVEVLPARLSIEPSDGGPLLSLIRAGDTRAEINAVLRSEPISVVARTEDLGTVDGELSLPPITLEGRLAGKGGETLLNVTGAGGTLRLQGDTPIAPNIPIDVIADGIAITIGAGGSSDYRFTADIGRIEHLAKKPLLVPVSVTSQATWKGGRVDGTLQLSDRLGVMVLEILGGHDFGRDQGRAEVTLHPLLFIKDAIQPSDLVPFAESLVGETSGKLSMDGGVFWSDQGLGSDLTLRIEDFDTIVQSVQVLGLNSAITFDRLIPPATPPGQLAAIEGIDLGLPLSDGLVSLRIDRAGKPLVEHSEWRWAGGQVSLTTTGRDPEAGEQIALTMTGIELEQLLNLTPEGDNISATGRLNGQIPIVFREGQFVIVDGWLESDFEGGTLQYSAKELESGLLAGGEGVKLLLDALQDFQYSRMRLDLSDQGDGETLMRFRINGANPTLYGGSEIALNVSVSGRLEQILRDTYKATYQLPEAVARQLGGEQVPAAPVLEPAQ